MGDGYARAIVGGIGREGFERLRRVNVFDSPWEPPAPDGYSRLGQGQAQRFAMTSRTLPDRVALLKLWGELDIATSPQLSEGIHWHLDRGCARIGVDLADIRYLDSTGFRVLIEGLHAARARGGVLALIAPTDLIVRLLRITGLSALFDVYVEESEAVERLSG